VYVGRQGRGRKKKEAEARKEGGLQQHLDSHGGEE
jgi:hypothetical protein